MAVSPGTEAPSLPEALSTCTRCPRVRSPRTSRSSVRATPFTSGSYVSVATSILMRRHHGQKGLPRQAEEGNETVTGCCHPSPAGETTVPDRFRHVPPGFSCTGNGTEEAASPTPCLEGAATKTAHFRKKTDESLNIRRSETTCGHPRIINPPSTKFFEKK